MDAQIVPVPCLNDNYAYLVHHQLTGFTLAVDPSEAEPVVQVLRDRNWKLGAIAATHHHWDHIGGIAGLKERFSVPAWVPEGDLERCAGADEEMGEGAIEFGPLRAEVLRIPGHTRNHVALYFAEPGAVFTGDTLFVLGCGRMFEGTPEQMVHSLQRLMELPASTRIYCGHEYFESNLRFALTTDGENPLLHERSESWLSQSEPRCSVPSTVELERRTNPFLQVLDPAWRARHQYSSSAVDAFALIRRAKDAF